MKTKACRKKNNGFVEKFCDLITCIWNNVGKKLHDIDGGIEDHKKGKADTLYQTLNSKSLKKKKSSIAKGLFSR